LNKPDMCENSNTWNPETVPVYIHKEKYAVYINICMIEVSPSGRSINDY